MKRTTLFFFLYIHRILVEACTHRHLGTTNPENAINIIDRENRSNCYSYFCKMIFSVSHSKKVILRLL